MNRNTDDALGKVGGEGMRKKRSCVERRKNRKLGGKGEGIYTQALKVK